MNRRVGGVIVAAALAAGACRAGSRPAEHGRLVEALAGVKAIGPEECAVCHEDVVEAQAKTVHEDAPGCETCHGPGGEHTEDPARIVGAAALRGLSPRGKAEMCLSCHAGLVGDWNHAEHARGGLTCFECHRDVVHFEVTSAAAVEPPKTFRRAAGFCDQCHGADALGFRQPFHHPVPEGQVDCADCHAVHGQSLGSAPREATEACGRCHARQAAPRVFRHAALDEGCNVCHAAHGSPLPALLTQDGNSLCLQCHFDAAFPVIEGVDHDDYLAAGARCYDCHTEVHGSNSDPSLLGRIR